MNDKYDKRRKNIKNKPSDFKIGTLFCFNEDKNFYALIIDIQDNQFVIYNSGKKCCETLERSIDEVLKDNIDLWRIL